MTTKYDAHPDWCSADIGLLKTYTISVTIQEGSD
jgi:hypothetical protein